MVLGRRNPLALLATVAILGATATFAVQAWDRAGPHLSARHDAALLAGGATPPAVLAARVDSGVEQLIAGNFRPQRLTGLTVVALLVLLALQFQPGRRALRRSVRAGRPAIASTRSTPPRAPPRLRLTAS